jgi:cytochrome c biogenesis protein CcmG/thiol:disulfide interchange protein DsbE
MGPAKARRFRVSLVICALVLIAAVVFSPTVRAQLHRAARLVGLESAPRPVREGEALRPMALESLDGQSYTITSNTHGTVVYNVFTTWCPSCREETPAIAAVSARLKQHGIAFIGIDQGEPPSAVENYARAEHLDYPIVLDNYRASNAVLGANVIPMTVIVHNGIVRSIVSGPVTAEQLEQLAENT